MIDSTTRAYVAGFLDGDGSIMLKIQPRADVRYGFRIYATICLYQSSAHESELHWMREQLGIGYVSRRNDGITELRIDGYDRVEGVLLELQEYIRFKSRQVSLMLDALALLKNKQTPEQFLQVCRFADEIANANYSSNRKYTAQVVERHLRNQGMLSP